MVETEWMYKEANIHNSSATTQLWTIGGLPEKSN